MTSKAMAKVTGLMALITFSALLLACPSDEGESDPRCIPGESRECACSDGNKGRQLCEADGKSLAPCECQVVAKVPAPPAVGALPGTADAGTSKAANPVALAPLPPPPPPPTPLILPASAPAGPATAALAGPFQPDSNTLALWHFDEATGGVAADTGRLRLTTALRNANWSAGRFGGAVKLSGSGANVQATANEGIFPVNEITIEGWVRPEIAASMTIYDIQDTQGLALRPRGTDVEAVFILRVNDTVRTLVSTSPLPLNQWHHVAGTFDGTMMRLFINGELAGELEAVGLLTRARLCDTPTIGSTCPASGGWFSGAIDEVRISDMARYTSDSAVSPALGPAVASTSPDAGAQADAGAPGNRVKRTKNLRDFTNERVRDAKRILRLGL